MTPSTKMNIMLHSVGITFLILLVCTYSIDASVASESSYNLTSHLNATIISVQNTSHNVYSESESIDYSKVWETKIRISEALANNSMRLMNPTDARLLKSTNKDSDLSTSTDTPLHHQDWSTTDNDLLKITRSSLTSMALSDLPASTTSSHSESNQTNLSYESVTKTKDIPLMNLDFTQNNIESTESPTIITSTDSGTDVYAAPLTDTVTKSEIAFTTKHSHLEDLDKNYGLGNRNNTTSKTTVNTSFYHKLRQASKTHHVTHIEKNPKETISRDDDIDETPNWIVSFHHYSPNHKPVSVVDDEDTTLIWQERKYFLSIIIPICVGILGACVIVAAAYFLRAYRVQRRRRNIQRMSRGIVRPQLMIKDRAMLLDETSEDDF